MRPLREGANMKVLFKGRRWETIGRTKDNRVVLEATDNGEFFEMTAKRFLSDEVEVVIDTNNEEEN